MQYRWHGGGAHLPVMPLELVLGDNYYHETKPVLTSARQQFTQIYPYIDPPKSKDEHLAGLRGGYPGQDSNPGSQIRRQEI